MARTRPGAMVAAMAAVMLMAGSAAMAGNGSPAFVRTENREACVNNQPLRQPFFGELHLHTQYSTDAATLDTRNTPRDAYLFAKGLKVGVPPFINTLTGTETPPPPPAVSPPVSSHPYCFPGEKCERMATRTIQLPPGRALDFAAITDHSEFFGEGNICFYEENVPCPPGICSAGQVCSSVEGRCVPIGYNSPECTLARQAIAGLRGGLGLDLFSVYIEPENPGQRFPFCGPNGGNCLFQASNIWQRIQQDAEEAYDRTSACTFTSFIGYEYTAQPAMGQCQTGNGGGSHAPCWDTVDCRTAGETCPSPAPAGGDNLHRNIIFRNADVPSLPVSTIEAPPGCGVGIELQRSHRAWPARVTPVAAEYAELPVRRQRRDVAVPVPLDPAQPEPERRRDVPDARDDGGSAAPPRQGAARRADADQGAIGVPVLLQAPRRLEHGRRAVQLREHELRPARGRVPRRPRRQHRAAQQLRPQHAEERPAVPAAHGGQPVPARVRRRPRQPQRHAGGRATPSSTPRPGRTAISASRCRARS